jgi:acetylornithine deacetylase
MAHSFVDSRAGAAYSEGQMQTSMNPPSCSSDLPGAETLQLLRQLISFPTVSRDSNLALIEFVQDRLRLLGADLRLTYDAERKKANLFATLGPAGHGGIVLSGHTDVVPVDGQRWQSDPFVLDERDGCVFGRGTADMKGFIACVLALLPEIARSGLTLPLHLALSYDEEVGCLGVGGLLDDLKATGIRPSGCIVGEPTGMRPVIAHKGKQSFRCHVRGLASHSAYAPAGVNAVEAAAEAIAFLKGLARRHRDQGPYDRGFDIAYTTIHTGVVHGGTALNIVPQDCVFDFEFRHLPGDDPAQLLAAFEEYLRNTLEPEMHAVDASTGFRIERLSGIPALHNSPESGIVGLAQELSARQDFGKVSFGTEASQFQMAGIPTVVCGPGSIREAHKPDEFVTLSQLAQCERFIKALTGKLAQR